MQRSRGFVVLKADGGWSVRYGGRLFGPYASQKVAISAARAAALKAAAAGEDALVLIQDEDGNRHVEWTYGDLPAAAAG